MGSYGVGPPVCTVINALSAQSTSLPLHDLKYPWIALNSLCRQEEGDFNYSIKTKTIMSSNYLLNILFITKLYVY